jgi:DNA-binding transcriptional MerR regulator
VNATALRIGDVAEQVGVTTRTIRYYEELGLLGSGSSREKGAHRTYDEADVVRLQELIRLRDLLGLTLEELVELAEAEEARLLSAAGGRRIRAAGSGSASSRRRSHTLSGSSRSSVAGRRPSTSSRATSSRSWRGCGAVAASCRAS